MHPTSIFTAAIQDVKDGLVDMAVGPYWVTGERLRLTSFTIPFRKFWPKILGILFYFFLTQNLVTCLLPDIDRTVLVIPKPGMKNSLSAQTSKVLAPFTTVIHYY